MRDPKLLLELSTIEGYGAYIKKIMATRPYIPGWSHNAEVTSDDWIYRSGLQDGFDLAMNYFHEGETD